MNKTNTDFVSTLKPANETVHTIVIKYEVFNEIISDWFLSKYVKEFFLHKEEDLINVFLNFINP